MSITRRQCIAWLGYGLATTNTIGFAQNKDPFMYGLIGKITAVDNGRDELASILIAGISNMPGCLSYIVAEDASDSNSLWVTEVWEDKAKHTESLSLPSVVDAIGKGRPLIAGFGERFETLPLGGQGLG